MVSENPVLILSQMKNNLVLSEPLGFTISLTSIDKAFKKLKITLKKVHRKLDRVNCPEKVLSRKEYALWFNNYINDYTKVVFVDESSFNLHICRSQGRSTVGTRATVVLPTIRGKSISLLSSICSKRIVYSKVISNSTVDVNIFSAFFEELCHFLKHSLNKEGVCLILDNARIHKEAEI
ncbi:hypothetical protein CDIK_3120, partial [Cucumispora dikerogammari]